MEPYPMPDESQLAALATVLVLGAILIGIVTAIFTVVVFGKIFSKAGYSWALGLLMLIPLVNGIMPFVLAFGDWPIHKELRRLREQQDKDGPLS